MAHRSNRMNLQWSSSSPVTCLRYGRHAAHKRLDSDDQPPAKCPRLSTEAGDAHNLLYGSSPTSPTSPNPKTPNPHQGPSRIGPFLLLPLSERESTHSAINTDAGDELLCKVCAIHRHCAISLNEWGFETAVLLNSPSAVYHPCTAFSSPNVSHFTQQCFFTELFLSVNETTELLLTNQADCWHCLSTRFIYTRHCAQLCKRFNGPPHIKNVDVKIQLLCFQSNWSSFKRRDGKWFVLLAFETEAFITWLDLN